jgi:hypothetical protein
MPLTESTPWLTGRLGRRVRPPPPPPAEPEKESYRGIMLAAERPASGPRLDPNHRSTAVTAGAPAEQTQQLEGGAGPGALPVAGGIVPPNEHATARATSQPARRSVGMSRPQPTAARSIPPCAGNFNGGRLHCQWQVQVQLKFFASFTRKVTVLYHGSPGAP